jgi:acyl-CoA hydrolase
MVAMGKDGKPCKVEPLSLVTEDEIRLYDEAKARRDYYKARLNK